ncbi:MAG: peptide chain release factor N(5)-glutamine methyltransferase [Gemmatimonadaceae bacterium]
MTVLSLPLTVRALREEIAAVFAQSVIDNPHDEARDLISAVLDQPRFWPVQHADAVIDGEAVRRAAERRAQGMPFAYAVGKAAFRHLTLIVDERVLIPRQETELLVDLVLDATRGRGVVADIGTGSGCIALALASEGRFDRVIATEVSQAAKAVSQVNADNLAAPHAPADIREGDLLTPLTSEDGITIIVSNPPYIARHEMAQLPPSVRDWEPHVALFSDNDGLAHTFRIVAEAPSLLQSGGLLALEVDSRRAQLVAQQIRSNGAFDRVKVHRDFTGRERYVLAHRR